MAVKTLQTVSRAVAMLRAFDGGARKLSLTELSASLQIDKANALRLARTLVNEGLLVHNSDTRRYEISFGCLALCRNSIGKNSLAELARPYLEQARDTTGETACLMVREAWSRVVVEVVPSQMPVRYVLDLGDRRPAYIGASGQCFMADLDSREWEQLRIELAEKEATRLLHTTEEVIRERIRALDRKGFAVGRGEWAADAAGAAAAVKNSQGRTVAAITMAIPLTRASEAHLEVCGRMALVAAQALSGDLIRNGI